MIRTSESEFMEIKMRNMTLTTNLSHSAVELDYTQRGINKISKKLNSATEEKTTNEAVLGKLKDEYQALSETNEKVSA
jgi:hypothetical protein